MSRIKSLRTIKWIMPFSALLLVVIAFFAFAGTGPKLEDNNESTFIWLRYDCSDDPQVLIVPGGTNYQESQELELTGVFSNCNGLNKPCAVRFLPSEVMDDPDHEGNKIPIDDEPITGRRVELCN